MAKFQGFVGSGRGKAGNLVFSKGSKGETIARAYQPQVKNPRTQAQILQRAKMNVVGQFSGLCSAELLKPLGMGSALKNRSEFNRTLLHAAAASLIEEGGATATFLPSEVKFSRGTAPILTTLGETVLTANKLSVSVTPAFPTGDIVGTYGERFIVGILDDSENSTFDHVGYIDHVYNSDSTQIVDISLPDLTDGQTAILWRVPFYLSAAGASLFGDGVHMSDSKVTARLASNERTLIDYWGVTRLGTIVPFVPAP